MLELDETIMQEMVRSTDRGAAILGNAHIEQRLMNSLKAHLIQDDDKSIWASGVLGSHGARIQIARLTGLISTAFAKDLTCLSKIRNAFAHDPSIHSFSESPIRDLIGNIDHVTVGVRFEKIHRHLQNDEPMSPRRKFEIIVGEAAAVLSGRRLPAMPQPDV